MYASLNGFTTVELYCVIGVEQTGLVGNVGKLLASVTRMFTLLPKNQLMSNVVKAMTGFVAGLCVG